MLLKLRINWSEWSFGRKQPKPACRSLGKKWDDLSQNWAKLYALSFVVNKYLLIWFYLYLGNSFLRSLISILIRGAGKKNLKTLEKKFCQLNWLRTKIKVLLQDDFLWKFLSLYGERKKKKIYLLKIKFGNAPRKFDGSKYTEI